MIPDSAAEGLNPRDLITRLRRQAQPLIPIPTDRQALIRPLTGIRALLFDVYGTLFISASGEIGSSNPEARGRALGQALEILNNPIDAACAERAAVALVEAIGETHGRLKQRGVDYPEVDIRDEFLKVLDPLYRDGSLSRPPSREFCETLAVEYECRINPTWPMPGCVETLRALQDQQMPLGIVSNAQFFTPLLFPALLDESLENLGFHSDLCAWSYRCGEAKPSAKLFLRVLEALQSRDIEPEQVLYVGNDRINDIWPAAQAGMKTGFFAGDRRSFRPREGDPRCQGAKEDILLTELAQLPKVLSPS